MNIEHRASSIQHPAPRIAVIGGGVSGLAAAHRIVELLPGAELTVFEASGRIGGVIDTFEQDGFLVERSADSFITKLPGALDLCRRLGLADELVPTEESRRRALVVRDGRLLPVPDGFFLMLPRKLWPMLTTRVLSLRGKLRLLAELLVPPRQILEAGVGTGGSPVLATTGEPPVATVADESVESFVCRRLGREVFERLVQPLMAGIYTADPAKLSMAATMPEFLAYERQHGSLLRATLTAGRGRESFATDELSHLFEQPVAKDSRPRYATTAAASGARYRLFVAPRQGMRGLIEALKNRLPSGSLRMNTRVSKIERLAGGEWQLTISGQPTLERYDGVIVALPAFAAADAMKEFDAALADELATVPYAGCAVVSVALRAAQVRRPIDSFGFVVPHVEGRRIIAASFSSAKFAGRAPHDGLLIRVFVGGALQPELMALPDNELTRLVVEELDGLLGIRNEPLWFDIARWPRSMPQYHVGHLARVERIEQLVECHPGLALAGNAYHGVGIPQCIRSGEAAAERMLAACRL